MADFKEILRSLCSIMTVTGCERNAYDEVKAMFSADFDEIKTDLARNIILIKNFLTTIFISKSSITSWMLRSSSAFTRTRWSAFWTTL